MKKLMITLTAFVAMVCNSINPASATTQNISNETVSCTNGTYNSLLTTAFVASTTSYTITQISTTPYLTGRYHMQNTISGNNSNSRDVANGGTGSWTLLSPGASGAYRLWHTAAVDTNCNGISPGNGNSQLSAKITY